MCESTCTFNSYVGCLSVLFIFAVNMNDSTNQTTNSPRAAALLSAVAYLHILLIIAPTLVLGIIIIAVII